MTFLRAHRPIGQIAFGVVILVLGILFLLDNLDIYYVGSFWQYWPLLIIVFGVAKAVAARNSDDLGGAAFWILIGIWLQISIANLWDLSFRETWPLAIVAVGVSMVIKAFPWKIQEETVEEQKNAN
ncbi:MAG: DUF5668 domain-containing protein [bacterium]